MATRRIPTARAQRANSNSSQPMPPPSANRPRSAMAKSSSSIRSLATTASTDEAMQDPVPSTSIIPNNPPAKTHRHGQDGSETNIKVVIRCRRRSDREIQDSSPIIVSSNGPKSQECTIETSTPISSLGIVTLPPTRTYPFDSVFGPEADQAMIYHDVVSPMLDEVLLGYNCTLFAYGQTGTGKTHTMQGDLTPTALGNPSANAGMIPRALFRLFHYLETEVVDYSVKISYIELYNEELRDLLASELSAPQGNTQPMGMGGGSKDNNNAGLKIFDDSNKRGVIIQGLEEISVKDAKDALALLMKGSDRRQIAATKFNDHSSRSHSVFSITVHTKETSAMGDDLLKIGKLNLVDLAGSENIGRSGAENKRAREAGMINQSLLTLGRVINALVDKAQHVPYRESKLTRLLQDSLGGRTKTCIIATISPARSNMEETLSTLDYAMRAKSIRNKPELNQRMTRNSLLKEYVVEIERLKADVLAAREKNGIFFSEETWCQLSSEQELRQTEIAEARKQVEIVESQMRAVREDFEQSIALLTKRDGELKEAREVLKQAEEQLEERVGELEVVKIALEEEVVVRKAHETTENLLAEVAGELKAVANESLKDVSGLFDKLQRKSSLLASNSKAVSSHTKTISSESHILSARLDDFAKSASQVILRLRAEAKKLQGQEVETLGGYSKQLDGQLQRVQEVLKSIHEQDEESSEAIGVVQSAVRETHDVLKSGVKTWGETVQKSCEVMCQEIDDCALGGFSAVEQALKAMGSLIEDTVRETRQYAEAGRESLLESKALVSNTATAEITRLRQQNEVLTRMLESEKANADRAKDQLIQRVSGLLGDFMKERDRGLREAVEGYREGNIESEGRMRVLEEKHGSIMNNMSTRGEKLGAACERRGAEGKRTRDGALKAITTNAENLTSGLTNMRQSLAKSIDSYSTHAQKQSQILNATCSGAFERHSRAKRARVDTTDSIMTDVQSDYIRMQRSIASTSRNVESATTRIESESNTLINITTNYQDTAATRLSTVDQATQALLEQGAREDVPTGNTPRKRFWQYVDTWELTQGREAILKSWRDAGNRRINTENGWSEPTPCPPEETPEEEADDTVMFIDRAESPALTESDEPIYTPSESPFPVSFASSTSSLANLPGLQPVTLKKFITQRSKSSIPTSGTLTERPTNFYTTRSSRRNR